MAQDDRGYFRKLFKGLPLKAQAIVALRAATRVLPFLAYRSSGDAGPFSYWRDGERDRRALAMIRCYQASAFVNLTKADIAADAARFAADAARSVVAVPYAANVDRSTVYADDVARSAAFAADAAAYDAARSAADAAAHAAYYVRARFDAATAAIERDIELLDVKKPSWNPIALISEPLWQGGPPPELGKLWTRLQSDLRSLEAGFEVWIDWYQDRLDGKPFDLDVERQWTLLSKEQLAQSPAEINAYLKALRDGALTKQLKRLTQYIFAFIRQRPS